MICTFKHIKRELNGRIQRTEICAAALSDNLPHRPCARCTGISPGKALGNLRHHGHLYLEVNMLISESPQFLKVAMERNLSIITGGTGKTTVLKAIIEVYCILHPRNRIVLAAPTGKTSRCMTQSSGIIARMSSLSSISEAAAITTRTG